MTKTERVMAAIGKQPVDYVPSCFSLHFPSGASKGEAGIRAHLDFFKQADTDILKIMNENQVPYCGSFSVPEDYSKVGKVSMDCDYMRNQLDFSKRILDACGSEAFTIGTLHGICASAIHPVQKAGYGYEAARKYQLAALRSGDPAVLDAFRRITDGMCELAQSYIEAGVQGIYYAALGAETCYFTDEEFARWIEPFDKQILKAIKDAGGYSFLHICKDGLNMDRYATYGDYCDVVNWGVYEVPYSLEAGRKLFPGKTIMGGLENRSGVLVNGTETEICAEVHEVIKSFGDRGFILGADCTLATEQDMKKLQAAVLACRSC